MDYSDFEPDYPHRNFKDRRKKKCNGVKGKQHRWKRLAGNDCKWEENTYPWSGKTWWWYTCQCTTSCADCGARRWNGPRGMDCSHKDWMNYTKPEEAR